MTSVYLIRHAQAQGNVEKKFQGRIDRPLTPLGKEQVRKVALRMQAIPLDAVYCSPLQRAHDTAKGIALPHGLKPVVCEGIQEIDGGDMENRTFEELAALYPGPFRQFSQEPHLFVGVGGGESMASVFERMQKAVRELVRRHEGGTIAIVSHGAALRCFMCYASGLSLEEMPQLPWGDNTAVSLVTFDRVLHPIVHTIFDNSHLAATPPLQPARKEAATV